MSGNRRATREEMMVRTKDRLARMGFIKQCINAGCDITSETHQILHSGICTVCQGMELESEKIKRRREMMEEDRELNAIAAYVVRSESEEDAEWS